MKEKLSILTEMIKLARSDKKVREKEYQFHRLVLLMNIDGEADKREKDYIKDIGIRMGLNPGATDSVLEKMNKYPKGIVPTDELIKIFTRYYN
jgi:hypothetical protein